MQVGPVADPQIVVLDPNDSFVDRRASCQNSGRLKSKTAVKRLGLIEISV
jgi:hypothetical protein